MESEEVKNLVAASLEKFNSESSLSKYFTLGTVTRATSGVSPLEPPRDPRDPWKAQKPASSGGLAEIHPTVLVTF